MTASTTKVLGVNGSSNLASLSPMDRQLIEADKTACLIRWKCQGLKGEERNRKGKELLSTVPVSVRDAVVEALKARASR